MEEIYNDVEKAIDFAFNEGKFVLDFYQYLKCKDSKRIDAQNFLTSTTANNIKLIVQELTEYLEGGQDNTHKQLREAYGYLSKPLARKIRNYLEGILTSTEKFIYEKRPGRRKKVKHK